MNVMIYKVAGEFAGIYYDAGRSTGLTSKFKNAESFARANVEKFIPLAIKHLMELLKPTSNITEHMRSEIYEALMDPVNDPELMKAKVNTDLNMELLDDQRKFKKLKVLTPVTSEKKTVLHR